MSVHRYYFHTGSTAPTDPGRDAAYWPAGHGGVMALLSPTRLPQPTPLEGSELASLGALAVGTLFEAFRFAATTPRAGTLAGRVRGVLVALQQAGGNAKAAKVHVRVRVLRSDNTVRGVLMQGTYGSTFSVVGGFQSASGTTRYFDAPMTPVADVAATDRLVVELGHHVVSGSNNNNAKIVRYNNQTADLPLTEGIVWSTAPANTWIEFDLEDPPPSPPANLRQTGATVSTIAAAWDAPSGGTAPTSYEYRLDGGAPTDVGLATAVDLSSLTAGTTYLLEVRARAGALTSSWAPLEVATVVPAAGNLRLEVGPEGAAVDLLGPAYTIRIRRGNATRGVTDALEAGTLAAVIDGPSANPLTVPEVRTGAPVRVLADVAGIWEPLYTGTLDRVRVAYDTGPDKADPNAYRVTLTATDVVPTLAATPTGGARAGSLKQRLGAAIAGPVAYNITDNDPATGPTAPLPSKESTVAGEVRLAVDTLHAVAYVDRRNVLRAIADNARPRTGAGTAPDYVATDNPAAPDTAIHYYDVTPSLDTDALVNVLKVTRLEGDDEAVTVHTDDTSVGAWGPHDADVTVNDGVPETHADLWLASRRDPDLRPEALAFNVRARPGHLLPAVNLEPYATISVERVGVLPAPVTMAVRNIEHHISADRRRGVRWLCLLDLRPPEVLATRWRDVPPTLRWSDLPAGMTWREAVRWHPYL